MTSKSDRDIWFKVIGTLIGIIMVLLGAFGNFALSTISKEIVSVSHKMDKQYDQIEKRIIQQDGRITRVEDVQLDRKGTVRRLIQKLNEEVKELKSFVYGSRK